MEEPGLDTNLGKAHGEQIEARRTVITGDTAEIIYEESRNGIKQEI
jgi:hypothetical protein